MQVIFWIFQQHAIVSSPCSLCLKSENWMHVYEWKTKGMRIKLLSSRCIPCGCVCIVLGGNFWCWVRPCTYIKILKQRNGFSTIFPMILQAIFWTIQLKNKAKTCLFLMNIMLFGTQVWSIFIWWKGAFCCLITRVDNDFPFVSLHQITNYWNHLH